MNGLRPLAWPEAWETTKDRALLRTTVGLGAALVFFLGAQSALRLRDQGLRQIMLCAVGLALLWVPWNLLALVVGRWRGYLGVVIPSRPKGNAMVFFPVSRPAQYSRQLFYLAFAAFAVALPDMVARASASRAFAGFFALEVFSFLWPILLLYTVPWLLGGVARYGRRIGVGLSPDGSMSAHGPAPACFLGMTSPGSRRSIGGVSSSTSRR